jgi:hypothetical protein
MTFAAYWISEWLKNTIHTTVAGLAKFLLYLSARLSNAHLVYMVRGTSAEAISPKA